MLKHNFQINKNNLKEILTILKDLVRINTLLKIKIDEDDVLFYTKAGEGQNIVAFKSFLFPLDDFLITDTPFKIDFIILDGVRFIKNLELFLLSDKNINATLMYNERDKVAGMFYIDNKKLKVNFVSGDYKEIKDITKQEIEIKMNPENANFNFTMDKEEFNEIKKLSTLNKSETVSLKCEKGKLYFYDDRWSVYITDLPSVADDVWHFNNKYLKSINALDNIIIYMFDQFLLFKEENIVLMIGLELSILK